MRLFLDMSHLKMRCVVSVPNDQFTEENEHLILRDSMCIAPDSQSWRYMLHSLNDDGKNVVYAQGMSQRHLSISCLATGLHLWWTNLQHRVYQFGNPTPKDLHGITLKDYAIVCLRDGPRQHWTELPLPVCGADGRTNMNMVSYSYMMLYHIMVQFETHITSY